MRKWKKIFIIWFYSLIKEKQVEKKHGEGKNIIEIGYWVGKKKKNHVEKGNENNWITFIFIIFIAVLLNFKIDQ